MSDPYEQWSDSSTTPFWDLAVGLTTLVTGLGGGLGAIFAFGYFATGRDALAWPLALTVGVLVAVNVALRLGRRSARRRA